MTCRGPEGGGIKYVAVGIEIIIEMKNYMYKAAKKAFESSVTPLIQYIARSSFLFVRYGQLAVVDCK